MRLPLLLIEPAEMHRVALPLEQRQRLVKRKTDDIGVGADEFDDETSGKALDRIAARFVAPFSRREIALDILVGEPFEANARFNKPRFYRVVRRHDTNSGIDAMRAAGQKPQARGR